jgi:hypothetical protein
MSAAVEQWRDIVSPAIQAHGSDMPAALVLAIMDAESSGDPHAFRGEAGGDGSVGLMQIMGSTAQGMGWSGGVGDRNALTGLFDPVTNVYYGVGFLSDLWSQLRNPSDVASAYNGGYWPFLGFGAVATSAVTVCLARDTSGNCTNSHTAQPGEYGNQAYVDRVMGLMATYGGSGDTGGLWPADPFAAGGLASSAGPLLMLALAAVAVWAFAKRGAA